jgi:hypothetical protein
VPYWTGDHVPTKSPREIRTIDASKSLKDNEYVRVHLPLDVEKAAAVQYLSKRVFIFIPFADTNYTLIYALEGPIDKGSVAQFIPTFTGRLASRNFADMWDIYDKDIKLQEIFSRQKRVAIPNSALVLYKADRGSVGLWQYFIGALGALYILFFLRGVLRMLSPKKPSRPGPVSP